MKTKQAQQCTGTYIIPKCVLVQYTARFAASPMQSKDGQLHVQYTARFAASPMQSKDGQLHVQYTARFAASPMQSKDRQLHVFPYAFGNCKRSHFN